MESVVGTGAELWIFWIVGTLMVIASLGLPFSRKPVHAAVALIFVMIGMAFLYTTLEAPFLGVAQVVVYTGAIMILFVFVLMLVGVDSADSVTETIKGQRWIAVVLAIGLGVVLIGVLVTATLPQAIGLTEANAQTNPVGVAHEIFGRTVFALELVGVLLIIAALCAITMTHREQLHRSRDQRTTLQLRQQAYARGEGSHVLAALPAPGVYAQHNAADAPALDPYGRPIDLSVPRVLRIRGQELDPARVEGHVAAIASGPFLVPDAVESDTEQSTAQVRARTREAVMAEDLEEHAEQQALVSHSDEPSLAVVDEVAEEITRRRLAEERDATGAMDRDATGQIATGAEPQTTPPPTPSGDEPGDGQQKGEQS